jgi:hypothetical protein
MAARLMLQSAAMRSRGIGWRADRCIDPPSCEVHLCVADDAGGFWHPADPLAFAKWRIRADIDTMPAHVMIKTGRDWDTIRRGAVWGAVGLGGTAAAVLGLWLGRQRRFSMKTLSGSGLYSPKASRSA